jgi:hypothetical protein
MFTFKAKPAALEGIKGAVRQLSNFPNVSLLQPQREHKHKRREQSHTVFVYGQNDRRTVVQITTVDYDITSRDRKGQL